MKNFLTLYRFELKKLLGRRMVRISTVCLLLVTAFTVVGGMLGSYTVGGVTESNADGIKKDAAYRDAFDGRLLDQTLFEEVSDAYDKVPYTDGRYSTTEEYQTYARPYSAIFQQIRGMTCWNVLKTMEWEPDEQEFYERWNTVLEDTWQSEHLKNEEIEFFREQKQKIQTPVRYVSMSEGYFELMKGINTFGLVSVFVVMMCLTGVFPEEHSLRTDQLILGCKNGKQMLFGAKVLAGVSFATALSLLSSVLAIGIAFGLYGTKGFDAPFYLYYATCVYPITMGDAVLIGYGMVLAACMVTAVFTMMLSELVHNGLAAMAITTSITIAGQFITIPGKYRVLSQLWDYLPSRFVMIYKIFSNRMVSLLGNNFMAWQVVPVFYLLIGIVFIWIGRQVYLRYQICGR